MPEIIDTLVQVADEAETFTVNCAVDDVTVTTGKVGTLYAPDATRVRFQWNDKLIILSYGIALPYQFGYSQVGSGVTHEIPYFRVRAQRRTALTFWDIPNGTNGEWAVPLADYELSLGVFVDTTDVADAAGFSLVASWQTAPRVSMLGAPAALDTVELECPIFMKVQHNLSLLAW